MCAKSQKAEKYPEIKKKLLMLELNNINLKFRKTNKRENVE